MASIRKRGDRWQAQVRRLGHLPQTKTFTLKAHAEAWARKMESDIERRAVGPLYRQNHMVTVAALLDRYRQEITPRKKSHVQETNRIERLCRSPMAKLGLLHLTPQDIARFRDDRLRTVGPQAVRHDLNLLSHVINTAMREWDLAIPSNPVAGIYKPPIAAPRERRLNEAEAEALGNALALADQDFQEFVRVAVNTGMRKSEILRITTSDIEIDRYTLLIPETKNGHARTIPLSQSTLTIFMRRMQAAAGRLFAFEVSWCRYHWDKVVRQSGVKDLHFHDLRHEAVSRFFERGLSVPEVALISGHKDYRMLARYTHLRAEDVAKKIA